SAPSDQRQAATADTSRIADVLLEVVSEKTGYPVEMLELDMGLDADLGIDSIKRVVMLSTLQELLPDRHAVKPDQLGSFQTLQHVVDHLAAAAPTAANGHTMLKPSISQPVPDERQSANTATAASARLAEVLLEVVSEKTGYPVEMLELDMGLDSDLGID